MNNLRHRILASFLAFTGLVVLLFGLASFMFAYTAEDQFFYDLIKGERDYVLQTDGQPRLPFIVRVKTVEELPDIVQTLYKEEPERREFAGENGLHYHLLTMQNGEFLLAEVSEHLVIRKFKVGMVKFLGVLFCIVLLIATAIAVLLSRRLTQPLDSLSTLLKNTPVDQLPTGFSDSFRKDEIGQFARILDNTMQRLRDFVQREQDFTRDVSHEIRTPITISQGALSLLAKTSLSTDQQVLVQRLNHSQLQIESALNTLLALAREEETSKAQALRLLPVVEEIILQQGKLLDGKDVEVDVAIDVSASVLVSKPVLTILLSNLLSNAFQYTQEGVITLSCHENSFVIRDSGGGISPEIKQQVLQSGVKGETSVGLGMGLSIVRRLCEKLNFDLVINTDSEGTEITVHF